MHGHSQEVMFSAVHGPLILDDMLDGLCIKHLQLLRLGKQRHHTDMGVNFLGRQSRVLATLLDVHSTLQHQINGVPYFLNFRVIDFHQPIRLHFQLFDAFEVLLRKHLCVFLAEVEEATVIRLDRSLVVVVGLWPLVEVKRHGENLGVAQLMDIDSLLKDHRYVFDEKIAGDEVILELYDVFNKNADCLDLIVFQGNINGI
jgi:hypothetical protein